LSFADRAAASVKMPVKSHPHVGGSSIDHRFKPSAKSTSCHLGRPQIY